MISVQGFFSFFYHAALWWAAPLRPLKGRVEEDGWMNGTKCLVSTFLGSGGVEMQINVIICKYISHAPNVANSNLNMNELTTMWCAHRDSKPTPPAIILPWWSGVIWPGQEESFPLLQKTLKSFNSSRAFTCISYITFNQLWPYFLMKLCKLLANCWWNGSPTVWEARLKAFTSIRCCLHLEHIVFCGKLSKYFKDKLDL